MLYLSQAPTTPCRIPHSAGRFDHQEAPLTDPTPPAAPALLELADARTVDDILNRVAAGALRTFDAGSAEVTLNGDTNPSGGEHTCRVSAGQGETSKPGPTLRSAIRGRGDVVLGAIEVTQFAGRRFHAEDDATLAGMAAAAAAALEVALFHDARRVLRAKDELLAMLCHELRTPMSTMTGWTELLRSRKLSEADFGRGLDILDRSVRMQIQIVDDLVDLTRIVSGTLEFDPKPLDVRTEVAAAAAAMTAACEVRSLTLEVGIADVELCVWGDRARIQQLVRALMARVIKLAPAGGAIVVMLSPEPGSVALRVGARPAGAGPGTRPEVPAVPATESAAGADLSLGLVLAGRLIELHDGTIEILGAGRSLEIIVRLPVYDAKLEPPPRVRIAPRRPNPERVPREPARP